MRSCPIGHISERNVAKWNKSLLDYGCAVPNDRQMDTVEEYKLFKAKPSVRSPKK